MSTSSVPRPDRVDGLAVQEVRGRVLRLLEFLREIVTARTAPVLRYDEHLRVQWLDADSGVGNLERAADAGAVVFRAAHVVTDSPPPLPAALLGLVDEDARADSSGVLELIESPTRAATATTDPANSHPTTAQVGIPGLPEEPEAEAHADFDVRRAYEIRREFDDYLKQWRPWADRDRTRRPQAKLYQSLQLMMQELSSRPEAVELVVASGLLGLPAPVAGSDTAGLAAGEVRTHLITQSATIELDVRTGDLLVKLSPTSSPRMEDTRILTGHARFDSSGSAAVHESLGRRAASPLAAGVPDVLKEWARVALGSKLDVPDLLARESRSATSEHPTLAFAPALVLRKRDSYALLAYYERMIEHLAAPDSVVPLGLAQLVEPIEPEDRLAWLASTGATDFRELADEPLFPLPANAEQSQIVHRLGRDSGVVVEGPPGTGKTHTIANLMSALLARGQRVLVTSEKSQALRVLRDKLPPELQELCVSVTDLSRGGSEELSRSVARIADRKAAYNDLDEAARIESLKIRRAEALVERNRALDAVLELRASETVVHPYVSDGYEGTAAAVVRKVTTAAEAHRWLPGPLFTERPPLSGTEVDEFRRHLATSPDGHPERVKQSLPAPETMLPNSAELRQLCLRAGADVSTTTEQSSQLVEFVGGGDPAAAFDIRRLCEELDARVREVQDLDAVYQQLTDSVLSGEAAHLWSRVSGIVSTVEVAAQADRFVGAHEIECSTTTSTALHAMEALAVALESGLEWRGRFRRTAQQKAVEDLGIVSRVDGVATSSALAARLVTEHIRALDVVRTAAVLLADLRITVSTDGSRSRQVNDLQLVAAQLSRVGAVLQARDALVERLYEVSPSAPWIRSLSDATAFAGAAGAIATRIDVDVARAELDRILYSVATALDSGPSPEGTGLIAALTDADADAVAAAVETYLAARREQDDQRERERLASALSEAAPTLYQLVVATAADPEWNELSWQLSKAWAWRRANEWVTDRHRPGLEHRLDADARAAAADLAILTTQLGASMAWRDCLERMTAVEVRALQTYREHISAIGSGAGKYADAFRSAARSAMRDAQSAVPAWVMPLQQVLTSIPPVANSFDVVIVDEASQADISSLCLLYLAPRVIVVGDDRQCAPADVPQAGTLDDVFDRLDVYLPDMPEHVRATLTPRSSLFSMLRTRFGQVVRLREHFRSMPEIINWSSQQFYGDSPLVPVRQFGADRLPPLRHTLVPDAITTGKGASLVNRAEVSAIVDRIVECLDDPKYDGKTFGVVVLQGTAQVDLIRNELIERIGIEQWENRRLRVGTPPDFQGDERNVVFLSMVVAPGQPFVALTANQYKRRFNVAASRAQDQLWLFHSVTVDRLKRTDLRNSLLGYMTSVSPAPAPSMPVDVPADARHPDFTTMFEQHVYLELRRRGYHVNPGIEVNGRRIDLVVTGQASRLAVECDGDSALGTDQRMVADLLREQELQRCGWVFWRVRESEFYLDPESALSSLWPALSSAGIEPESVDIDSDAARDESRAEWVPLQLEPNPDDVVVEVVSPTTNGRDDAGPEPSDAATEVWMMPPEDDDSAVVEKELPINGSFAGRNGGFYDGGFGRLR